LSGFISRVDRNAPKYGGGYRDFNSCYYQANAAATGGSSGSPVVNIDGYAVALQAGGRTDKASTDYFLPLDAPLRALQLIREGLPVPRGDVQCTFLVKTFEECRRLGLTPRWEDEVRAAHPGAKNMLVAENVLPGGPSDGMIDGGDIVLQVNGMLVVTFRQLEDLLNAAIGPKPVRFLLQRGGLEIERDVLVEDLDKVSPDRFVSVAGAGFHDLSYQQAVRYAVARKGVYMCESGPIPEFELRYGYLIESINHTGTPNLARFIEIMKDLPDRAQVTVCYRQLHDLNTRATTVFTLNRHWPAAMKMLTRNDATGEWDFEILAEPLPRIPPVPRTASFPRTALQPAVGDIARSFVAVSCHRPLWVDGYSRHTRGMGIIVDAGRGIVLVSRAVVPHSYCTIEITIADTIRVDGKVTFLHPTQNYSLVQYEPSLVLAEVRSATFASEEVLQGTPAIFVGYTDEKTMVYTPTTVTRIQPIDVDPLSTPQYRPINLDWIGVGTPLGTECDSGVIMAEDGKVLAVWMSCAKGNSAFRFGLGSPALLGVLSRLQDDGVPGLRILPVEFGTVTTFEARARGLSDEFAEKVGEKESRHQLLIVKRAFGTRELLEGDVLLTLNGELVTKATELDVTYWNESLDAVVLRDSKQMSLVVHTVPSDMETARVVCFAGLVLTKPHLAVRQQIKDLPSEVYVASRQWGSPATAYSNISSVSFITHINNISTPSLDSVLEETLKVADNACKHPRRPRRGGTVPIPTAQNLMLPPS
jgi:pro-apoptotic serine protease NMA111